MIVAERAKGCTVTPDIGVRRPIDNNILGFYTEQLIVNHLNEPIYVVSHTGKYVEIPQCWGHIAYPSPQFRVQVLTRRHNGDRKTIGNIATEKMESQSSIDIPLEVLRIGPVYVETINVVICTSQYLSHAYHPMSEAYQTIVEREKLDKMSDTLSQSPILIKANDPQGSISKLFVDVHGVICQSPVSNFKEDPDSIKIGYRVRHDREHGNVYEWHETTFAALRKNGLKIKIGPCEVSISCEYIATKNELDSISLDQHNTSLKEMKVLHQTNTDRLQSENDLLKKKVSTLEKQLSDLKSGNFADGVVANEMRRLEVENQALTAKLESIRADQERTQSAKAHEVTIEKHKTHREKMSTFTTLAKVAGVFVPLLAGLWKFFGSLFGAGSTATA